MLSKTEDLTDKSEDKLLDTKTNISKTVQEITDKTIPVTEDVIGKTLKVIHDGKIIINDNTKHLKELSDGTKSKVVSGAGFVADETEETLAEGKTKIIESSRTTTDKFKDRSAHITDETVTTVNDGKTEFSNSGKNVPESVKGTKQKTKSFLGSIFGKSEETTATSTISDIIPSVSKTLEENVSDSAGDVTKSVMKSEQNLESDVLPIKTSIVVEQVDQTKTEIVDSIKPSANGKDKTPSLAEHTADPSKDSISLLKSKVDSETGKTKKSKTFIGGLFSKAEEVVDNSKIKLDNTTSSISKAAKKSKGKATSITKDIIEKSEEALKGGQGKIADTTKTITEISKDAADKTKSVGISVLHKTEQVMDDGKTKIVETTTKVVEKTTSLSDDVANKTSEIGHEGKIKIIQTKKSVSDAATDAKDQAKSVFSSTFIKEGQFPDESETNVTTLTDSISQLGPHETEENSDILGINTNNPGKGLSCEGGYGDRSLTMFENLIGTPQDIMDDGKSEFTEITTAVDQSTSSLNEISKSAVKDFSLKAVEIAEGGKPAADSATEASRGIMNKSAQVTDDILHTIEEEVGGGKTQIGNISSTLVEKTKVITSSAASDLLSKTVHLVDNIKAKEEITSKFPTEAKNNTKSPLGGIITDGEDSNDIGKTIVGLSVNETAMKANDKTESVTSAIIDDKCNNITAEKNKYGPSKARESEIKDLKQNVILLADDTPLNLDHLSLDKKTELTEDMTITEDMPDENAKILSVSKPATEHSKSDKENTKSLPGSIFTKSEELIEGGKKNISETTHELSKGIKEKTITSAGNIIEPSTGLLEGGKSKLLDTSKAIGEVIEETKKKTESTPRNAIDKSEDLMNKLIVTIADTTKTVAGETKDKTSLIIETATKNTVAGKSKLDQTDSFISHVGEKILDKYTGLDDPGKPQIADSNQKDITKVKYSTDESFRDTTGILGAVRKDIHERKEDLVKSLDVVDGVAAVETITTEITESISKEIDADKVNIDTKDPRETIDKEKGQITSAPDDIFQKSPENKVLDAKSIVSEDVFDTKEEISTVTTDMFGSVKSLFSKMKPTELDSSIRVDQSLKENWYDIPPDMAKHSFDKTQSNIDVEDTTKSNDDKLNNILIDMLIEQECMKSPIHDMSTHPSLEANQEFPPDLTNLSEKHDTEVSEKASKDAKSTVFKTTASFGKIESLIGEADFKRALDNTTDTEQAPYVTTPTMQRRKIGGSQRLSREERPALREVTHVIDYSSSEEDETNHYIVTEPSEQWPHRKVTFHVESEDEAYLKVSDSSSEPEIEVTEMTPSPVPTSKRQDKITSGESAKYIDDQAKSKTKSDKNIQKVERRFERMASETLEADPAAKFSADREFQRMVSQLSNEEVDACLSQWEEGGLTPSEELDSTKDTVEGDLDLDVEALPEAFLASTNPFYSSSSQWVEFEHNAADVPSSIFWAYDAALTGAVIQPNELDIPIKPMPVKGESAGEEAKKSPAPTTTRESDEALLDLAAGLQDTKGSGTGSGPSSAK